jgi:hypothetical protein
MWLERKTTDRQKRNYGKKHQQEPTGTADSKEAVHQPATTAPCGALRQSYYINNRMKSSICPKTHNDNHQRL